MNWEHLEIVFAFTPNRSYTVQREEGNTLDVIHSEKAIVS